MQQILQNSPHWQQFKGLNLSAIKWGARLKRSAAPFHAIAIASILAYAFIYVNLPTFLFPGAGHDDGLFISQAHSIALGHWLGPYNQFTLMKGPGYPLFLALISLYGISVPLAHAVFFGLSVWLFSYATNKILNSTLLSLTVLEILLWHFGPHSLRVIRDEIYTPQILIVFSLLVLTLFVLKGSQSLLFAVLAGIVFGWLWITREDGLIIAPAIVFTFAFAFLKAYRDRHSVMIPTKVLAGFMSAYGLVLGVVCLINLRIYDTFSIVDIKGGFEKAFEALESVKPAAYKPFVAISMDVREKVYKVSPTFSQLRDLIEQPGSPIEGWKKPSCDYLAVCGDYATGWFMWAFRDAVALHGDYSSAGAATTFYENVRHEVSSACNSKVISCYDNSLPFMPHVEDQQLWQSVPSMRAAIDHLSLKYPQQLEGINSIGTDDQIRAAAQFLGIRNHAPPPSVADSAINRPAMRFALNAGNSLLRIYSRFLPLLLSLGLCATVVLIARFLYQRSYSVAFAIACAAWIAVASRLAALVLIDISSFPTINHLYIGYAYPFSCYASLISIFLVGRWVLRAESFPKSL